MTDEELLGDVGESMNNKTIAVWQRRFQAQPKVYLTFVNGEYSNAYATRDAAQREVEWRKRTGRGRASITTEPVHSLELSEERWPV